MADKTSEIKQSFMAELEAVNEISQLEAIKVKYLGKNGLLQSL